jgi:hypothetical protein
VLRSGFGEVVFEATCAKRREGECAGAAVSPLDLSSLSKLDRNRLGSCH